ncbi:HAMP domain-containing protein [Paenibacillus larvae]|uniref:HAMP domain-containing protein n=1 Tax=Paenibacillus larvae TaxID=1464 RepID=A0AAP5N2U2_9BACL|nr:HAMP domain-containing protein [Paenibacillus larvae]AQR78736.1 HAMP domain-containing protein [Paenibacillus larvae subsp. larvae]MCY9688351.1 HAMP domain-containing protein [Paenibacillus larvae]MDT2251475.1 HAMP domain-containing protein [Paenibacillus larvae]
MVLISLVALVITIVFVYVFAARFVRPIHKLNQTVKEVAEGDLTKTTHVQGKNEIVVLSQDFN